MKNKKFLKTLATLTVGAVAAVGCLGFVACGDDNTEEHQHNYTWTANTDGTTHNGHCSVDGCDKPDVTNENHVYDNDTDTTCNKCDYVRTIGGGTTEKVDHTFTYSYSAVPAKADKGELTQADFTGDNAFLTVASGVTYRVSAGCIEVKDAGLKVTFKGTGKITIDFGSTSGTNTSGLALLKADGSFVEGTSTTATKLTAEDALGNKAGLFTMTNGTKPATAAKVEFTVSEAGTYTIYCLYNYDDAGTAKARGSRIFAISMVDNY